MSTNVYDKQRRGGKKKEIGSCGKKKKLYQDCQEFRQKSVY